MLQVKNALAVAGFQNQAAWPPDENAIRMGDADVKRVIQKDREGFKRTLVNRFLDRFLRDHLRRYKRPLPPSQEARCDGVTNEFPLQARGER